MVPKAGSNFDLVATNNPSVPLATATGMNLLSTYNDLPPARYTLQVFPAGDRQTPLKNLDAPLRDGSYVTILVHEASGTAASPNPGTSASPTPAAQNSSLVVELVDDTPDPAKPDNQLTVRQYCPGARVIVSTATKQMTDTLNYGASQTLTGLPSSTVPLVARAATRIGARTFNAEADFTGTYRTTLLLMDDPYGRFKPRLVQDGPPRSTPAP